MEIYKFGGASLASAKGVKNVANIITNKGNDSLVVVVSAMGKTTNALEDLLHACIYNTGKQRECYEKVRTFHVQIVEELFGEALNKEESGILEYLDDFWLECVEPMNLADYDYHYDQLVSYGESFSSIILGGYLEYLHHPLVNIHISNVLITDSNFREGKVDWETSTLLIQQAFQHKKINCFITEGFVAGNNKGDKVTLGREGSDYTAAILGNILHAEAVTVWKNVDGILNADPRWYLNATKLNAISYQEAVELAYYGAQVIHPKSIKPLHEKNIPLIVRSFIHPEKSGTQVTNTNSPHLPPLFIKKENQTLISIASRDFSFIMDEHLQNILFFLAQVRLNVNLCQVSALELSLCVNNEEEKITTLQRTLEGTYKFRYNNDLTLYTIRHYDEHSSQFVRALHNKTYIEQKTRSTWHLVLK